MTITAGSGAEEISGDILCIGSLLGDVRSHVFDHIVGFELWALFEAALGVSLSEVTLGASIAAAVSFIETEAELTLASIIVELAAAAARLGGAATVANSQADSYKKLVADIKK